MQNDLKIRENPEGFGGCHTEGPSAAYMYKTKRNADVYKLYHSIRAIR